MPFDPTCQAEGYVYCDFVEREAQRRFPGITYNVPEHTREALECWIKEGRMPGDFVRSVVENDLRGAVTRADYINAGRLKDIIDFLNMEAPSPCWGSRENVLAWALKFAQERERGPS